MTDSSNARTAQAPPNDLDAELSVLGSVLLEGSSIAKVSGWLRPDDFYRENNGQVYKAALALHENGLAIDNVTLANQLAAMGLLDRVGGRAQLASTSSMVPTAANIEHYGHIVKDKADLRRLIKAGQEIAELASHANGHSDFASILERARETVAVIRVEPRKAPVVSRVGFGWEASFPGQISMKVGRLRESSGELSGELTIVKGPNHTFRGRFNFDAARSRVTLANLLEKRVPGVDAGSWGNYLEQFCNAVLGAERQAAPIVRLKDLPPREDRGMLIDPFLPGQGGTVLYAPGGIGKSMMAAAMAVMVATGESIIRGWRVNWQARPLILDYEDDEWTWASRIAMLARGHDLDVPDIGYMPCRRPLADELEAVADRVHEEQAGLVIIDSAGLAMGDSGQYADAADGALKLFGAVKAIGLPALIIDHVAAAEQKNTAAAKPYGSVYKWNSARMAWELKREKEPEEGRAELLLIHGKYNNGERHKPIGLEIMYQPTMIFIGPTEVESEDLAVNLSTADRLARLLRDGMKSEAWCAQQLGVSQGRIRQVLMQHRERFGRPAKGQIGLVSGFTE